MQKIHLESKKIELPTEATRIIRSVYACGFVLLAGLFIWSMIAPIKGSVVASGNVKIETHSKVIQHLEGGIVKEIFIKEGATVKKDQPLLRLEDTEVNSQRTILLDQLNATMVREASLIAQRVQVREINFPEELLKNPSSKVQQLLSNEKSLFQSKRKTLDDKVRLLSFQISQTENQIQNLLNEISAINKSSSFIEKQFAAKEKLSIKGFIGRNQLWDDQRKLSEKRELLNAQRANITTAQIEITTLRSQINNLENEYKQEAEIELKETRKKITELEESLRPIVDKNYRSIITAPLAGQVINLQVNTVGGVIAPGQKLMEIVPTTNQLQIEVKVDTKDIDFVHVEQSGYIQLLSYNRRKTPLLTGKVIYVSGDVLQDQAHSELYYYLAYIQVDQDSLKQLPPNVKLFPGMPVSVFLQKREKTFMDFCLEPVVDLMRHTFRED